MFALALAFAAALSVFFSVLYVGGVKLRGEIPLVCSLFWLFAFIVWMAEAISASLPPV